MNDVAVVILNYNGKKYLEKFLPILINYTSGSRIVVADNDSSDDSVAFLKENFSSIEILRFNENYGFAGGYNKALSQIDAKYFAIINSDIEVTANWLDPLYEYLESNEDYTAVQGKIRSYHLRTHFEYAGAAGGFVDNLGYPYCRGRIFDTVEEDLGQYDSIIDVDWTTGACMLIRSSAFNEMGGFDDHFFAHMEEIDLCWRMRSKGWKLACIPSSLVYHVGGGTLNKTSPFKTYLNFRNGLFLLIKNLPLRQLIWKLPVRLILDGLAAIKLMIQISPRHMLAILKAHLNFYLGFIREFKKRQRPFVSSKKSIVMAYYLRRKSTFNAL